VLLVEQAVLDKLEQQVIQVELVEQVLVVQAVMERKVVLVVQVVLAV
jgi:hypothetical protein|tara:strand:- start:129 stop:269 length:141 start_codon:yes stop_codon:yes gene_type:complete